MSFCCEDTLAVYEKRKGSDKNPQIVVVTIPGMFHHVYYRSNEHIHNLVNSPIPTYVGPPSGAPEKFYGPGTYEMDKFMMSLV